MAFDFGSKRIGVAFGQTITNNAEAIANIKANDGKPDWTKLDLLIEDWKPDAFIIGLPLNMDGSLSLMSHRAKKFANRLRDRYQRDFFMMDERLSSVEAKAIKANSIIRPKDPEIDSIAASVILASWLKNNNTL